MNMAKTVHQNATSTLTGLFKSYISFSLLAFISILILPALSHAQTPEIVAGGGTSESPGDVGDGGPATSAILNFPYKVAVDNSGNLLIADTSNGRIRRIITDDGVITGDDFIDTIAGNGNPGSGYSGDGSPATATGIGFVRGLAVDSQDNLFFTESRHGILHFVPGGSITTVTSMNGAYGITADSSDNLFVADPFNNRILRVDLTTDPTTGIITGTTTPVVISGSSLFFPFGVAVDTRNDNLFIADTFNNRIILVNLHTNPITGTITGTITATVNTGGWVEDLAVDSAGNVFYVTIAFPTNPAYGVWKWDGESDPEMLTTINNASGVGVGGSDLYIAALTNFVYKLAGVADSGNQPPVAVGTASSQKRRGCGRVKLDGRDSYDPDNDPIVSYTWTGPFGTVTGATTKVTMPLGTSNVNLVVNDGTVDSGPDTIIITITDTTAPKVRVKLKKKRKKGCFRVQFSVKDICDSDPTVVALLNGVSVTNGQIVKLIRDDDSSDDDSGSGHKKKRRKHHGHDGSSDDKSRGACGDITLVGHSFTLEVTATDDSGNVGTKTDTFVFRSKHEDDCSSGYRKLKKQSRKLKELKKKWRKRYRNKKKINGYHKWKKWRRK